MHIYIYAYIYICIYIYIYISLQNITLQNINYYMSGTFVTKFSLVPISNKVFHT